jgi:hypothetical protein
VRPPNPSAAEAADVAQRLSWYMPTVNRDQEAAVAAVIYHFTDF